MSPAAGKDVKKKYTESKKMETGSTRQVLCGSGGWERKKKKPNAMVCVIQWHLVWLSERRVQLFPLLGSRYPAVLQRERKASSDTQEVQELGNEESRLSE